MGELRKIVEEYVKTRDKIDQDSPSAVLYREYRDKYKKLIGKSAIWKTFQNKSIKQPQLVTIEAVYNYFLLVSKDCYSLDGKLRKIRYSINFASLYAKHDKLELVE